ncbi:Acyl- thioesterase [Pyrenophora seminiperda CCB06]|uniref:Acyl-thioesterase n=1 Tax=Pyrenophora seminiperda CCB06 TaxID=1302712 RepID=A0A3M7MJ49_9PLEO|nr:Acyl- thioesterase [Pyrenophora seminiperda CCB06]
MSSSKSKPQRTILPLVIPPLHDHNTTIIILHGRGSSAEKFAEPLLTHMPELKQHLQAQGLRETSAYLHDLLKDEIKIVGASNVVLMGLSQGCAASIIAMLLWKCERIRALVGMCGYVPFRKGMYESVEDTNSGDTDSLVGSDDDQEDMFERDNEEFGCGSKFEKAVDWLREELGISQDDDGVNEQSSSLQSIPVFMGHGRDDEKVPCCIGKLAAEFLCGINVSVTWQDYAGLGHWYSADMLRDVVDFLNGLN